MNITTIIAKNASTILTVVGTLSMGSAAVLSVLATPKAMLKIDELREAIRNEEEVVSAVDEDGNEVDLEDLEPTKLDILKAVWPCYIPTVACVAGGVACIIIAKRIDAAKIAALTSTVMLMDEKLQLRDKAMKALDPADQEKVKEAIDKETIKESKSTPPWIDEDDETLMPTETSLPRMMLCMESITGQYFLSNADLIRKAENDFNKYLIGNAQMLSGAEGSVSDWFSFLDDRLETTSLTDAIGWNLEHPMDITLDTRLRDDDRPVLVVNYRVQPKITDDYLYTQR